MPTEIRRAQIAHASMSSLVKNTLFTVDWGPSLVTFSSTHHIGEFHFRSNMKSKLTSMKSSAYCLQGLSRVMQSSVFLVCTLASSLSYLYLK